MPAAITHYLHAKRVLEKREENLSENSLFRDAFFWGAQGPDFLFCSRFLPWQKGESLAAYGGKLHKLPPEETLGAIRKYQRQHPENECLSWYIRGFLCHYSADRICHPFVCFGAQALLEADPSQNEEVFHNQIESALDIIMLRYETAQLPLEFPLKRTVPKNQKAMEEIAGLYVFLLQELFAKTVSIKQMLQALGDCRTIFSLLTDRTGFKKNLVEHLERNKKRSISCHIRGISEADETDYANLLNGQWKWPPESEIVREENFFDVYERAIEDALELIRRWPSCEDLKQYTGELSFEG